jgi:hypothetical protein
MHATTFEYLKPSEVQMERMQYCRDASKAYAKALEAMLPDGPDKTYCLRKLRTVAMWANVCITRNADGSPRQDI